jgi:lipopolysaccharide transport system permease protein
MLQTRDWEWEIKAETSWLGVGIKELIAYKDLLFRLVRKEFLASFQQTLLGPLWVIFQPLLTVLTYVLVFGKLIGLSTEGFPSFIYYLTGITLWNLFSDILMNTSITFMQNIGIFSKVYFPRLIAPLSTLLLYLLRFGIQLIFLLIVYTYYCFAGQVHFDFLRMLIIFPVIIIVSGIGFGAGLIFSILSTKYKDLLSLMQLLIRLLMFICPIFYSLSVVPEKLKGFVYLNPLSSQFEIFRFAFLGKGVVEGLPLVYSMISMIVLVAGGVLLFNKMGDKLMDVA